MTLTNEPLFGQPSARRFEPRATRVPVTHRDDIEVEIWVGGADTSLGDALEAEHLEGAWLIDCAGELTPEFRASAQACFPRVFADIDVVPSSFERIALLAREVAAAVEGAIAEESSLHGHERPVRLFVMCSQGFNRSALVAGLILRSLGADPAAIIDAIRAARPGALTNETFVRLIEADLTA